MKFPAYSSNFWGPEIIRGSGDLHQNQDSSQWYGALSMEGQLPLADEKLSQVAILVQKWLR